MRVASNTNDFYIVDGATGEVLGHASHYRGPSFEREGTYWKVYPAAGPAIKDVPFNFVVSVLNNTTYANKGQRLFLLSKQKKIISDECNLSERMIEKYIARMVDDGALRRVKRGEYIINPYCFGRGKWADVLKLRKDFDMLIAENIV